MLARYIALGLSGASPFCNSVTVRPAAWWRRRDWQAHIAIPTPDKHQCAHLCKPGQCCIGRQMMNMAGLDVGSSGPGPAVEAGCCAETQMHLYSAGASALVSPASLEGQVLRILLWGSLAGLCVSGACSPR